jgi:hypothetical protein
MPFALVALLLVAVFRTLRWKKRTAPDAISPETRMYVKLRSAYERARLVDANVPPLGFLTRIAAAPGAAHARALVRLYLTSRFAGEDIGEVGRGHMRVALDRARAALRG